MYIKYKKELENFLKNRIYIVSLVIIALLAYGFSAVNITVGIDDLECERYIGKENELVAAGRFGWLFWTKIFGLKNRYVENNFVFETVGVILLIWAAINFCILFKKITADKIGMPAYTIFSCTLISYPLMNEIWEYTGVNIAVCGAILFVSFALILMKEQLMQGFNLWKYMVTAILLMIVCAGYESVAVVYVFLVFLVLFLQIIFESENTESLQSIIKQGCFYASVLAIGVVLRVIVHKILLIIMDLPLMQNGDTNIWWGKLSVYKIISDVFNGILREYIVKGIIYFPLTELNLSVIIFLLLCMVLWKRKVNRLYLLPALGMLLSLILLTLLKGGIAPYRTCQVFAFFVATVMMLLIYFISSSAWKYVKKINAILILLCGVICIHQASTMNYYFTMNFLRSEEEARVICDIGEELNAKYNTNKPVIFVGNYEVSESIRQRVMIDKEDPRWYLYSKIYELFLDKDIYNNEEYRKLPNTNVNSVIKWAMNAFGDQKALGKLFEYYGFKYEAAKYSLLGEAKKYVEEHDIPAYPREGYIQEREGYIIVNME